jgi:hypothetical protein
MDPFDMALMIIAALLCCLLAFALVIGLAVRP